MAGRMPIARSVYVCDDAIVNADSGKPTIVNLWDTIRVPSGQGLPFFIGKLCLFAWLRDVTADASVRIEIRDGETFELTVVPLERVIPANAPDKSVWARFRIKDVPFRKFGTYIIDVLVNGELLDYQVIEVIGE